MRFVALFVGGLWLGACGARGSQGPAWPETAERETDGGESIAPREADAVAAVEETAVEPEVVAPAAATAATPGAAAVGTTPTVTTPTVTAPEDTITIDEIVIEITDESD